MPNGSIIKEGGLLWYMASEVPGQRGGKRGGGGCSVRGGRRMRRRLVHIVAKTRNREKGLEHEVDTTSKGHP